MYIRSDHGGGGPGELEEGLRVGRVEGEGGWRVGGGGVAPNFVSINFFGLVCRGVGHL